MAANPSNFTLLKFRLPYLQCQGSCSHTAILEL